MRQLVEKIRTLEAELSKEKGPFLLFALLLREDALDVWDILVSAPWIDVDRGTGLRLIVDRLGRVASTDEMARVSKVVIVDRFNPALKSLQAAFDVESAVVEVSNSEFFGFKVSRAFIITSRKIASIPAKHLGGWFELNRSNSGSFYFVLKAGNGEAVLASEMYGSKSAAENGIAAVQKNSLIELRYDRKVSSDGRFYFNLKAANHAVIGTSQMYKTASDMERGVEFVKANGAIGVVNFNG